MPTKELGEEQDELWLPIERCFEPDEAIELISTNLENSLGNLPSSEDEVSNRRLFYLR